MNESVGIVVAVVAVMKIMALNFELAAARARPAAQGDTGDGTATKMPATPAPGAALPDSELAAALEATRQELDLARAEVAELRAAPQQPSAAVPDPAEIEATRQALEAAQRENREVEASIESGKNLLATLTRSIDEANTELADLTRQAETARASRNTSAATVDAGGSVSDLIETDPALAGLDDLPTDAELDALLKSAELLDSPLPPLGDEANVPETATAGAAMVVGIPETVKPPPSARVRFDLLDDDGDRRIDRAEFNFGKIRFLDAIDTNRDKYLTNDETLLTPETFEQLDRDRDGRISQLEFIDAGDRIFLEADLNNDGSITFDELSKMMRPPPG